MTDCMVVGGHKHFMSKEIFEQAETVVNTMRGRVNFEKNKIKLGGIENFVADIRNSRRIIFIACGTSYHSAVAVSILHCPSLTIVLSTI